MFNSLLFSTLIGVALAATLVDQPHSLTSFQQTPLLGSSGCPVDGPISCREKSRDAEGSCCLEAPGGLLLLTQFWDTHPSTGPDDSWTIHGLWPDHCDGSYDQNCDPSRAYKNIAQLLSSHGASDTLDVMKEYWVDLKGRDEQFWAHEWSTHGTCYSTLNPRCLQGDNYDYKGAEAVIFFQTVVRLFKAIPVYKILSDAGIEPSTKAQYTLDEFISALKEGAGYTPAIQCSGKKINSIAFYYNLRGSMIDGTFIQIDSPKKSTCPKSGKLQYLPKSDNRGR